MILPFVLVQHSSQYEIGVGRERSQTITMLWNMLFLTIKEAGGHTMFPQAGISVKPRFNVGPKSNYDFRIVHLGCPVWIASF